MKVLGINTGLGASICLLEDGGVRFAIEDERLTRVKNGGGFPSAALAYALEHHGDFMRALDAIGICDLEDQAMTMPEMLDRFHRRFREDDRPAWRKALGEIRAAVGGVVPEGVKRGLRPAPTPLDLVKMVRKALPELDLPDSLFHRLKHHDCHAAAAYHGLARDDDRPYLVLTLDGGGDRECASVSIGRAGRLERISSTESGATIGGLYSALTYLLGFKPHEHEYKIMGLAPYTPDRYGDGVYKILSGYIGLGGDRGLEFVRRIPEKLGNAGLRYSRDLRFTRFDNIAVGLQRFTEDLVCQWVANAIKATGVSDVLLSGGVFMNIKMNKRIAEMAEVSSVDVFPSCGDESNAFGIAFHIEAEHGGRPRLDSYCTGPGPDYDLAEARVRYAGRLSFETVADPAATIARLLADGHVVARCAGPMEFGARALGNRSLLADPTVPRVVERINHLIKQRDFWMPFAPAVLAEDVRDYVTVPPSLPPRISPYMMFGFETHEDRRPAMAAALHRADQTARVQAVDAEGYPGFHKVISAFKAITGRSVVLNTSYNLHGSPIVMGTVDAIEVMLASDLDYLMVEDTLITRV
ncbi:MAG: carbamoyltransferase C-terminal domain-containing protein [Pseudomonadota bacterium]